MYPLLFENSCRCQLPMCLHASLWNVYPLFSHTPHLPKAMIWNHDDLVVFRKYQRTGLWLFPSIIFSHFSRHINMPKTVGQPGNAVAGFFKNSYNQMFGMRSVMFWLSDQLSEGAKPVSHVSFQGAYSIVHWFWTKSWRQKVQKSAIDSTALIMQICFIWTVITTDKAPQGVMTDVSLWL